MTAAEFPPAPTETADIAAAQLPQVVAYDSASYTFPAAATHVFEYFDGPNARHDLRDFYPHVHDITVQGGSSAWHAQFLDFEQGLTAFANPAAAREWCEARIQRGKRAIFYCDRANLARLRGAIGPILWQHSQVEFWIPTLDGRFWPQSLLSWDIAHNWGVYIAAARIWGCQGKGQGSGSGGPWDETAVYNSWN